MDDKEQMNRRPEDKKEDEGAQDTEGNLFSYGSPKKPDDPGRENPTGREASDDEGQGGGGFVPKH